MNLSLSSENQKTNKWQLQLGFYIRDSDPSCMLGQTTRGWSLTRDGFHVLQVSS
jgi:hypothetical protein